MLVIALSALRFLFFFFHLLAFFSVSLFVLRAPECLNQMKRPKHLKRKFSCRRETEPYKLTWPIWVAVAALFFPLWVASLFFSFSLDNKDTREMMSPSAFFLLTDESETKTTRGGNRVATAAAVHKHTGYV